MIAAMHQVSLTLVIFGGVSLFASMMAVLNGLLDQDFDTGDPAGSYRVAKIFAAIAFALCILGAALQ